MKKLTRQECGRLGQQKAKEKLAIFAAKRREEIENSCKQRYCPVCRTQITFAQRKNVYCSQSCAAIRNNEIRGGTRQVRRKTCLSCSRQICKAGLKYCTRRCQWDYKWSLTKATIERTGKTNNVRAAKHFLIDKYGYQCSICGLSEWLGNKLVMILDHIDGNPMKLEIAQLRLLCPNCDSQTPTWKGRNAGKGRHSRKMRYREGKSF